MRPPNPRFADGETVTHSSVPVDPAADADDEGNYVRRPVAGTTYLARVGRQSINRVMQSGTVDSVEGFRVLLYSDADPSIRVDDTVAWKRTADDPGRTLWAMCDATPCGTGAWVFDASEVGPTSAQ